MIEFKCLDEYSSVIIDLVERSVGASRKLPHYQWFYKMFVKSRDIGT